MYGDARSAASSTWIPKKPLKSPYTNHVSLDSNMNASLAVGPHRLEINPHVSVPHQNPTVNMSYAGSIATRPSNAVVLAALRVQASESRLHAPKTMAPAARPPLISNDADETARSSALRFKHYNSIGTGHDTLSGTAVPVQDLDGHRRWIKITTLCII